MRLYNYLIDTQVLQTNVTRFDMEICGVTSRSSEVRQGYIFVCIRGAKSDGHDYALEAKSRGAVLLVIEGITECVIASGLPFIAVSNTRAALAKMCACSVGHPERRMKLTGVTGTNGKTSTVRLLSEIYRSAGIKTAALGTLNGNLTTPDPEELFAFLKDNFDNGITNVVMEASSHALYYDKLCGIQFHCGIFTNLTGEHLDFHKSMREYALSKAKLFSASRLGIFNYDDGYMPTVASMATGKKITYSATDKNGDIHIENCVFHRMNGFEYDLAGLGKRARIRSHLCGGFNIYNTLAAASAALCDGLPLSAIAKGIEAVGTIPGRLERLDTGDLPINIYIDYAHTPDALEKVLDCIRRFKEEGQSITLVFGCGGDRDRSKRKIMGQIASRYADLTVVTSDNSRSEQPSAIISEILKGIDKERPYTVIENRKEAIEYAVDNTPERGIILLAGKGHEAYEIDSSGKHYFNEKKIAADAVFKRFNKK